MWSNNSTAEPPRFKIGRYSDNELVLFDEERRESWIVYPPRSAYDFLSLRRPSPNITLVEHHPWTPFTEPDDHQLDPKTACQTHALDCPAQKAIQAAVELGFNPFA